MANGTISTLDGTPKATWTFAQDGRQSTQTCEVGGDEFDAMWEALSKPAFMRHVVVGPHKELDVRGNYLVGVTSVVQGEPVRHSYLVPVGQRDPVWRQWLARIDGTRRAV